MEHFIQALHLYLFKPNVQVKAKSEKNKIDETDKMNRQGEWKHGKKTIGKKKKPTNKGKQPFCEQEGKQKSLK